MNALIVNRDDLVHNIETVKKTVGVPVIGVLKNDGYGLDIVKFAEVLRSCDIKMFAVCDLWEARALRKSGFEEEILLMRSTSLESEVREIIDLGLTATIGSYEAAVTLNGIAEKAGETARAHIEVDTGFGRYGFTDEETDKITKIARFLKNIDLTGIYMHCSNSFGDEETTKNQIAIFNDILAKLERDGISFKMRHAANSCAALRFPYARFDAVRIGSAFLGRLPIHNTWGLKKIGALSGDIIEIRWLKAGQNVGYANVYSVKKATRIAVIPVGYADGYCVEKSKDTYRTRDVIRYMLNEFKHLLKNKSRYVTLNRKKARVLGRVCMCNIVVDVTKIDCAVGDTVTMPVNPLFVDKSVARVYEERD